MIRDAVVHLLGEQPVLADLIEEPLAGDQLLMCTNLRTLDGKRPVFIDDGASRFVFPYRHIRFIEIRPERGAVATPAPATETPEPAPDEELEIDEDFLRRIREA